MKERSDETASEDTGEEPDIIAMALDACDDGVELPPDLEQRLYEAADAVRKQKSP